MNALRRKLEILDIQAAPEPESRSVEPMFGEGRAFHRALLDAADHPMYRAAAAAYAEQARPRPPIEQTEGFQLLTGRIRALLADVPKATRAAFNQARARFTEVEHVLLEAEAELARVNAERPLEVSKIDRWASEAATAERRVQALTASRSQAVGILHDAQVAVLAALTQAALRREAALHATTEAAQQAAREAQIVASAANQDEQDATGIFSRIRDWGLKDQYVASVLKGEL